MKHEYPKGFDDETYEILNMVFDLISGTSVAGCYNLHKDDLAAMVDEVDGDTKTIRIINPNTKREYSLTLNAVYAPAP